MRSVTSLQEFIEFSSQFSGSAIFIQASAAWCVPCRMLRPVFELLAEEVEARFPVQFVHFDVNEAPGLAAKLQVTHMPTFVCMYEQESCRIVGPQQHQLIAWVHQNLNCCKGTA